MYKFVHNPYTHTNTHTHVTHAHTHVNHTSTHDKLTCMTMRSVTLVSVRWSRGTGGASCL